MIEKGITAIFVLLFGMACIFAQPDQKMLRSGASADAAFDTTAQGAAPSFSNVDSLEPAQVRMPVSTGWSDEAVAIGYVAAPSVLGLMFISTLVSEWNSGYFGIPASAMILAVPPLLYLGGRSVTISAELYRSRASLGWTLYGLSILPAALALYGFTTDWGATLPLTIASGILGTASIVAMTTYAFGRSGTAKGLETLSSSFLNIGLMPVRGGMMASLTYRF